MDPSPEKEILPQLQHTKPTVSKKEVLVASVKSYMKVQENRSGKLSNFLAI